MRRTNSSTRLLLPVPGSPNTFTTRPEPAHIEFAASTTVANSSSWPINGMSAEAMPARTPRGGPTRARGQRPLLPLHEEWRRLFGLEQRPRPVQHGPRREHLA